MTTSITTRFSQSKLARVVLAILALIAVLAVLWAALAFVKDTDAPERLVIWFYNLIGLDSYADALLERGLQPLMAKLIIAMVALVVGVVGIWAIFITANRIVDELPTNWRSRIRPYIFVGPAMFLLTVFLIFPVISTVYTSLSEDIIRFPETVPEEVAGQKNVIPVIAEEEKGAAPKSTLISTDWLEIATVTVVSTKDGDALGTALVVRTGETIRTFGLGNYKFALASEDMHIAFRNNILWLIFGVSGAVGIGLVFAQLVDRVKREAFAKTFIFLPMAISFVGAAVIWRFVYWWQPPGRPQIGLLNAIWVWLGNEPVAFMQTVPLNTFAMIVIMVWLMTGFAMWAIPMNVHKTCGVWFSKKRLGMANGVVSVGMALG